MNRARPLYTFPKREACLMAMSYSYELQAKVFDRMTELEAQVATPVPALPNFSNPAEAARAWGMSVAIGGTAALFRPTNGNTDSCHPH